MYKFAKINLHSKLPDLLEWRLLIAPEDLDTHLDTHKAVYESLLHGVLSDPHNPAELKQCPKCNPELSFMEFINNPIVLCGHWLAATTQAIQIEGKTIAVNRNGGWSIPRDEQIIDEIQTDTCVFPGDDRPLPMGRAKKITISRWPDAKHWYMASNFCSVFIPNKYNTVGEALAMAGEYVDDEAIEVKDRRYQS